MYLILPSRTLRSASDGQCYVCANATQNENQPTNPEAQPRHHSQKVTVPPQCHRESGRQLGPQRLPLSKRRLSPVSRMLANSVFRGDPPLWTVCVSHGNPFIGRSPLVLFSPPSRVYFLKKGSCVTCRYFPGPERVGCLLTRVSVPGISCPVGVVQEHTDHGARDPGG